jgi:hypothetical protein
MRNQAMAADPTQAEGAEAEAGRLSELGSRDAERPTDAHLGVAGGGDPDPLLGTADPPGGPIDGAPGVPGAAGAADAPPPPRPAAPPRAAEEHHPGPAPETDPPWRAPDESWTFVAGSNGSPPEVVWDRPADDGDLRPPAEEPEDGRL